MNKISRQRAIKRNLNRYYTEKPCRNGHISERYVTSGRCVQCKSENGINDRKRRQAKIIIQKRIWYELNFNEVIAKTSAYTRAHPEQRKHTCRTYAQRHRGQLSYHAAKRRVKKLKATLDWLADQQLQEIITIYEDTAELSAMGYGQFHVDHIQPLQGKDRCGLHVPWNLQILPAKVNMKKSNKIIG